MGIDAEMFVRIKGKENWLKDDDELAAAVHLARTVGPEKFYIGDDQHALSIIRPQTSDERYVDRAHDGKVVWRQDGPEIIADDDEQFIRVHLWSRYYAPGYERGDWPTIRQVAEWLDFRFPGGEVWYGGDSSGACASKFDNEARDKMNGHYLNAMGRTGYTGGFGSLGDSDTCPRCKIEKDCSGGGGGASFMRCSGCGKKTVLFKGEAYVVPGGVDHFAWREGMGKWEREKS